MKKIEKLTTEQRDYLPVFRDEWLKVGLSTKSIDRDTATAAVQNLYAAGGLEVPIVMHFQSPWQCIMAINFFRKFGELPKANLGDNLGDNLWDNLRDNLRANLGDNLWANLGDNLWDNLRDNLGDNLWDNLGDNLGDNLRDNLRANLRDNLGDNLRDNLRANLGDNLWDNLGDNLRANLWDNLWANLWDNLGDNLWDNLRDNLWANLRANLGDNLRDNLGDNSKYIDTYFWGGMDAPWLAFYEFGQKIGVKYDKQEHLEAYKQFSRTCGISYFYPGLAFVSDRPEIIRKDPEFRLHCEDGPALKFMDGYSVYCWHGTNVLPEWIEKSGTLTAKTALTWGNIEQRRAACEILGWSKILEETDAKIIDDDGDPLIGTLVEAQLPDLEKPARFLRVRCGTGREFAVGVPLEINTAIAAQAWMSGRTVEDFTPPEIRT